MTKDEAGDLLNRARQAKELSWQQLADAIGAPLLWTISALLGQHPVPRPQAEQIGALLELDVSVVDELVRQPMRGPGRAEIPSDPTLYRFYEALMVFGPAIKEYINEEFGDGIMSAINFTIAAERRADPGGDRVVVTFDGKFLPYQWG